MSARLQTHIGTAVTVPGHDIDTDRIIPARFLKCVTFEALGPHVLHDERFAADGTSLGHPLDAPAHQGATVWVSGDNFGCGSSREHAPQALLRAGFRSVIAGSFAEIFFNNALAIGLPCVTLTGDDLKDFTAWVDANPNLPVHVQLNGVLIGGERRWSGHIPASAQSAFREGRWDPLAELHQRSVSTRTVANTLPYTRW